IFSLALLRPLPPSPLFPYTTLFRSVRPVPHDLHAPPRVRRAAADRGRAAGRARPAARRRRAGAVAPRARRARRRALPVLHPHPRSEEHTSELQSLTNLVSRLLLHTQ